MSNTAPIPALNPDLATASGGAAAPGATAGTSQPPQSTPSGADLRLVIEDDKAAGSYVYITMNTVTGEVVSQVPREQLLKMRESPDYQPGSIVNART
jgi:flagellar protein FlaG